MTDTGPNPAIAGRAHPTAILVIILASYFMILLDNSIIFTGLPTIGDAMDLSPVGLSWVQDAYTLVFGGLLLLGARLGDILGRRRVFVAGLAVFSLASLLVACAPTGGFSHRCPRTPGHRRGHRGTVVALLADCELSGRAGAHPRGGLVRRSGGIGAASAWSSVVRSPARCPGVPAS